LQFQGPRTPDELYGDARFVSVIGVRVQRNRVMRTRPRFPEWSLRFTLQVITDVINSENVKMALETAGLYIGIGDYRPRYGRFRIRRWDAVSS
jgi:hypothetical protein